MELTELREQIDRLDDQLLDLCLRRLDLADRIADYKQAHGLPTADAGREREILDRLTLGRAAQAAEITALYQTLFSLSRARQDRRRAGLNIVLIGMPGCGKSTVGRLLGQLCGKTVVDLDDIIAGEWGLTIPELIASRGEEAFRELETRAAAEYADGSGLILVTGGGIVEKIENLPLLRQNGRIYLLMRDLDRLPVQGRPLSEGQGVGTLWQRRRERYEAFRDVVVDNNGPAEQTARAILDEYAAYTGRKEAFSDSTGQ